METLSREEVEECLNDLPYAMDPPAEAIAILLTTDAALRKKVRELEESLAYAETKLETEDV